MDRRDGKLFQTAFFGDIGPGARQALLNVGVYREAAGNSVLFLEGDVEGRFFILVEGAVKLYKLTPDGREIVIRLVCPGEMFAEAILFERDDYPVSALVTADSLLFEIPRRGFLALLGEPAFRDEFIGTLMRKMRFLADRILQLTAFDVEERFFRFVADRWGRRPSCRPDLSKKELAQAIGTTPETLSRLLARLARRKLATWENGLLEIDPACWELHAGDG
ncbi:MAG: Crp/Fnr family transcriptional regulator [Candidatus Krumholzibacteriota bacterium]|nr:Crp/Fnr family transcriptional regulator [Candidatus Krumholzibacteriota bacterium]